MKTFPATLLAAAMSLSAATAEGESFTTGEIRLRTVSGPQQTEIRYRIKNDQMRVDHPGEIVPAPPVNLIDLKTGTLRILHPHNGTWWEISGGSLQQAASSLPGPPPGIGPKQGPGITPHGQPGRQPTESAEGIKIGPDLPGLPGNPRSSQLPPAASLPDSLPPGFNPSALVDPGGVPLQQPIPNAVPSMPRNFPGQANALVMKATDEKRVLHGYECTRHTVPIPREGELILWLPASGLFPPFHLMLDDAPHHHLRADGFEQIPALLRGKNYFPLLAVWKTEDGQEAVCWEVTRIAPGEVDSDRFVVPDGFYKIE